MVKSSISKKDNAAAHLAYIKRDGATSHFFSDRGNVDIKRAEKKVFSHVPGEKHHFRFIISPEFGGAVDMKKHTREVVQYLERVTGAELQFYASVHENTDHPHAHLLIRGVDKKGREVRIPKETMWRGIREFSAELLTQELGERSKLDVQRQRNRERCGLYWTSLDATLQFISQKNKGKIKNPSGIYEERLRFLGSMGLAYKIGDEWTVRPQAKATLQEYQRRGDIIRTMQKNYKLAVPYDRLHLYEDNKPLSGTVEMITYEDELRGKGRVTVIKDKKTGNYYMCNEKQVPLHRVGEKVTMGQRAGVER